MKNEKLRIKNEEVGFHCKVELRKNDRTTTLFHSSFIIFNFSFSLCFLNFRIHQRKGGIHEINRYDMGTFGSFLVGRTVR